MIERPCLNSNNKAKDRQTDRRKEGRRKKRRESERKRKRERKKEGKRKKERGPGIHGGSLVPVLRRQTQAKAC